MAWRPAEYSFAPQQQKMAIWQCSSHFVLSCNGAGHDLLMSQEVTWVLCGWPASMAAAGAYTPATR